MSDGPPYTIEITLPAQRDLERLEFGRGLEDCGGLLGRIEGYRTVVDRVVPNQARPYAEDRVPAELNTWMRWERWADETEDECRLVGDVHSHENAPGPAVPSAGDLEGWADLGRCPHQISYAGVIVSAADVTVWEAGYPSEVRDWSSPLYRGWVADANGEMWAARIDWEDEWFFNLRSQVRFQPRSSYAPK